MCVSTGVRQHRTQSVMWSTSGDKVIKDKIRDAQQPSPCPLSFQRGWAARRKVGSLFRFDFQRLNWNVLFCKSFFLTDTNINCWYYTDILKEVGVGKILVFVVQYILHFIYFTYLFCICGSNLFCYVSTKPQLIQTWINIVVSPQQVWLRELCNQVFPVLWNIISQADLCKLHHVLQSHFSVH